MGTGILVALGIIIQVVLLISIFDIYFTTPIIKGVAPIVPHVPPLCKRVVVISVDGLRLDALLENDTDDEKPIAPYIRWSMLHRGTWGVSQSHLPTESRPGHVAMLAGFYEDPSAVTKGWKENPVDFDSIFNRSICSFAWGSPDIVNIFYKDLKHPCAFKFVYDEVQDFSGNTMELDNWVLEQLVHFFQAAGNPSLYTKSNSLFFLHLLGQDTSGHTHKPKTVLYRENLHNVDRIVKEVDALFGGIFRDNDTAFVLTADHGMTDWGSHGAGDPSETLTPVVAWGRGIKDNKDKEPIQINQADITPLLAALIGIPIPVNSIGVLPDHFLNVSKLRAADAIFLNAQQISAQFLAKRNEVEAMSSLLPLRNFETLDKNIIVELKDSISTDLRNGRHAAANEKSRQLIQLSLEGIAFYQNYYQCPLFILIATSYMCWIILLILKLHGIERTSKASPVETSVVFAASLLIVYVIYKENLPYSYHAYSQLPIFLMWLITPNLPSLFNFASYFFTSQRILATISLLVGIEIFVLGFFERWTLSISLAVIVLWPFSQTKVTSKNCILISTWVISGCCLGVFLFLPVVGKLPHPVLNLFAAMALTFTTIWGSKQSSGRLLPILRCLAVASAGFLSYWVHSSFLGQGKLNGYSQWFSWSLLVSTPLFLIASANNVLEKLQNSFCSLAIPFILLSVSHEGLFLLVLFVHLASWVRIEMTVSDVVGSGTYYQQYTRRGIHADTLSLMDLRRAYFFLAYIYIAFFGIGNLATLNSFDPAWVRCFLTSFSPFTMTALILLKVVVPFFAVSLALRVLTLLLNMQPYKVFVSVLIYCNLMALNFLFLVRNEGSWLDIGTSLSHYIIQQVTIVFLLFLYLASQAVIPLSLRQRGNKSHFF